MAIALLVICVGLLAWFIPTWPNSSGPTEQSVSALRPVLETYDLLQQEFVSREKLSDESLSSAAIRGMIQSLQDPYVSYLTPEQQEVNLTDTFGGIGVNIGLIGGKFIIVEPLPGSPGEAAGLRAGDEVISVDGTSLDGLSLTEGVALIRGENGVEVDLEILHEGASKVQLVSIVRDTVVAPSVRGTVLNDGIGYVRISGFQENTPAQLRKILLDLEADGARGLILDLRDNSGGLVSKAVDVASEFLTDGIVLETIRADGKKLTYGVNPGAVSPDIPLVVLINGGTVSSAEMVAGALQDYRRGVLVGTRTFGKGHLSILAELSSGAGLNITSATWVTPKGRSVEGVGLEPDVRVGARSGLPDTPIAQNLAAIIPILCSNYFYAEVELRARPDLDQALADLCSLPLLGQESNARDVQLEKAVELLESRL